MLLKENANWTQGAQFGLWVLYQAQLGVQVLDDVLHLRFEFMSTQFDRIVQEYARSTGAMRLNVQKTFDELFEKDEQLLIAWHHFAQQLFQKEI